MSLEFPIEKRKIGKFYLEAWDGKMVEYHSDEKLNTADLHETIKEKLHEYGLTVVDGFDFLSPNYGNIMLGDLNIGLVITISSWYGTTVSVRMEREKTTEWRAKFKERLADLEKILETF